MFNKYDIQIYLRGKYYINVRNIDKNVWYINDKVIIFHIISIVQETYFKVSKNRSLATLVFIGFFWEQN